MRRFTIEDEKRLMPFVEEGIRDIEENGTISWGEFWALVEEDERREGLYKKNNTIKLRLTKRLEKISKKFVRV